MGPNNLKGLGHQNRDLIRHLRIHAWLLTGESQPVVASHAVPHVLRAGSPDEQPRAIDRFLDSIDVLVFAERPGAVGLTREARRRGIPVICIPNWEWIHPGLDWLSDVDLMLCPTKFTTNLLHQWQVRFGFHWQIEFCPWPIDTAAFPFKARSECGRVLYINGTDRHHPRNRSNWPTQTRRKGLETLLAAAWQLPNVQFLIWSQVKDLPRLPENVELRIAATSNTELYREADVCMQLSRWEGIGLALLESQASGMPLITVDAPPMNEHNPLVAIPVAGYEELQLWSRRWIAAPMVDVASVVQTLTHWHGRDILQHSFAAREFIDLSHSWEKFRTVISACISALISPKSRCR